MSYFALVALINTLSSALLGVLVYIKNRTGRVNKAFFYYSISITLWSLGYYFWQVSSADSSALFWCKVLTASAILIPIFYSQFVDEVIETRTNKVIVYIFYLISFALLCISFTDLLVSGVRPIAGFSHWPIAGPLYSVYLLIWVTVVLYSIYRLIYGIKNSRGQKKVQLLYITIATIVGYGGGATNFPLWYGLYLLPWGNILISFYAIAVSYAIIRLKMLNIKVLKSEATVLVMLIVLLIDALVSSTPSQTIIRLLLVVMFAFIGYTFVRNVFALENANKQLEMANAQLEDDKKRLKEVDKLKDDFLSMASHELNTPIAAIEGYLSMILVEKMAGTIPPKAKTYLESVYSSAQRLSHQVKDLLNVSRIESNRIHLIYEEKPIEDVIKQAVMEVMSKAREAKHTLTFEEPKKPMPKTWYDATRITEIIINILGNAIKYTDPGGKITARVINDDDKIVVSVEDNGRGIPKDKQDTIFEKFSQVDTLKDQVKGTGLGMYISKRFVELHKGKIWFHSDGEGKGTTFFFSLPIVKEKPFDPHEGEGEVLH